MAPAEVVADANWPGKKAWPLTESGMQDSACEAFNTRGLQFHQVRSSYQARYRYRKAACKAVVIPTLE